VLNLGAVSSIAFVLLKRFIGQKNEALRLLRLERERSESLLLNVLPAEVAERLKDGSQIVADHYDSASILFADLVGFTPLSAELSPREVVEVLNEIYSHFDSLVAALGVEKIRTIGDSYMVAAGLPRPRADHAQALARLALAMNDYLASRPPVGRRHLSFRIGINSGAVIAGVIGVRKFHYDVWGDAVNIASRMESHGTPGRIQVTRSTYELIQDEFHCEPHGSISVKGRGMMETWFLEGRK
jgi:guanylate cyclase